MRKAPLVLAIFVLAPMGLEAQNSGTGLPPFGSLTSFGFDTVNNLNLNVYFAIPLVSSSGRRLPLNLTLTNNSLIWQKSGTVWIPVAGWGWLNDIPAGGVFEYQNSTGKIKCFQGSSWFITTITSWSNLVYLDALGTPHYFPSFSTTVPDCPYHDPRVTV